MRMRVGSRMSLLTVLLVSGPVIRLHGEPHVQSRSASVSEIAARRIFQEPLVPVGNRPSEAENADLSRALDAYVAAKDAQVVAPVLTFLQAHPGSAWRPSLLANLGWVYRQYGFLGKAKSAWQEAWDLSKSDKSREGQTIAEVSLGYLANLLSQTGRHDELASLMREAENRPLSGTAGTMVALASEQLKAMEQDPAHTFRCGPEALGQLAKTLGCPEVQEKAEDLTAGPKGTNLAELQAWAKGMGLDLVGICLTPGTPIPIPSLISWKAGHFATATRQENGRILVKDYFAGQDQWISQKAFCEEAGAFALMATRDAKVGAWPIASELDLTNTWGAGTTSGPDNDGPHPDDPGNQSCPANGMARYSMDIPYCSLTLKDIPIWYRPPVGPSVEFHLTYNLYEQNQPQTFKFSNLSHKWTFDWLSYVQDDPANPGVNTVLYQRGGGILRYSGYNSTTGVFSPNYYQHDQLVLTSPTSYTRQLPDGSMEVFSVPDGAVAPRKVFLSALIDPTGNKLAFSYDSQLRLVSVTDAIGQVTTLSYDNTSNSYLITRVTDPFGRTATFTYGTQALPSGATDYDDALLLTGITDMIGITSSFNYSTYSSSSSNATKGSLLHAVGRSNQIGYGTTGSGEDDCRKGLPSSKAKTSALTLTQRPSLLATASVGVYSGNFTLCNVITSLTTPYGTTNFSCGVNGTDRFLQATDPMGQSERMEYHNLTSAMPMSDAVAPSGWSNTYLYYRNAFYWDKRAMATGAGDWTQAKIYHFLHSSQNSGYTSPLLESTKSPLESRVWYRYGQGTSYVEDTSSLPIATARILDDGTTQETQAHCNAFGKVTQAIDAMGRTTTYVYAANGLDLLEVHNTTNGQNDMLAKYTYNGQHMPLTVTDASSQTTTLTYNAAGQVQAITNPKNETTTFTYAPAQGGYLTQIAGPLPGSTTSFTYDALGRVQTVTSPDGNVITTSYDNLDRPTTITYSDGSTERMIYSNLDLAAKLDRIGRWTYLTYNPLRQLVSVQDASGRTTSFDWCTCGSLEQLTDPMVHITNWWRDLQGRVVGKSLNDGTQTSYAYDSAGRLVQRVDAKGRVTQYLYALDNNLSRVNYLSVPVTTPSVSYTYDTQYNRLSSMTDGFGTTQYSYNPIGSTPGLGAGRLAMVAGPFPNSSILYSYDELGRVTVRGINGVSENRFFDSLGRISSVTNALGTFGYSYLGETNKLSGINLPNGQVTTFNYYETTHDSRLQGISNQRSDQSVISAFNYIYNPDGTIQTWSQQADANVPNVYTFTYDGANQLIGAVLNQGGPTGALIHQYTYGYDLACNRTSEQIDGNETSSDYNGVNQLTTQRNAPMSASKVAPSRISAAQSKGRPSIKATKTGKPMALAHPGLRKDQSSSKP